MEELECECDFSASGDPLSFEKCSTKCCPLHDPCESCSEIDPTCKKRKFEHGPEEWLCDLCNTYWESL